MSINGKAPKPSTTHLSKVFFLRPGGDSKDGYQEVAAARAIRVSKTPPAPYHYYMLSATVKPWALSWVSSYPIPSLRVQMEGRPHPLPSDPVIPGYLKSCMEGPKNSLVCDRNAIMGCQALCQLALYKYEELIKPALNLIQDIFNNIFNNLHNNKQFYLFEFDLNHKVVTQTRWLSLIFTGSWLPSPISGSQLELVSHVLPPAWRGDSMGGGEHAHHLALQTKAATA